MSEGARLGPFELGEKIGEGGMGVVYRGRHRTTNVSVAVKVVQQDLEAEARARFEEEVRAQAKLAHPGVVYLFEYGEMSEEAAAERDAFAAGSPYVVMELADAGTVGDHLPFQDWQTVREIIEQTLEALAFAHAHGVIHRDLEPNNLLVFGEDESRRIKLGDFGLAQIRRGDETPDPAALAAVCGTPAYMAPEQTGAEWRRYGPWTDLYSLGCIVWELVCGQPPYDGESPVAVLLQHADGDRPDFEPRMPVPAGLDDWIDRMLAVEPGDRFRRAADARAALDRLSDEYGPAPGSGDESEPESDGVHGTLVGMDGEDSPPALQSVKGARRVPSLEGELHRSSEEGPSKAPPRPEPIRTADLPSQLVGAGRGLFGLRVPPFVDRGDEFAHLWRCLREVSESGDPRVVIVVGASGVGKSRLIDWMTTRAHELGAAHVFRAFHTPGGEGPTEGLRGMVRRALSAGQLDRYEVYRHLSGTLPELERSEVDHEADLRALTELIEPTEQGAETVDGPRYRYASSEQKCAVVGRLVARYAQRRTSIVWLDDAQWAELAIPFAEHLVDRVLESIPALAILTLRLEALSRDESRRERVRELESHDSVSRIELDRFGRETHRQFVERMLPLTDELAEDVAERTEGNPLFATHLIRELVDSGKLRSTPEGFELGSGEAFELPDAIQDLWTRRLERVVEAADVESKRAIWEALDLAAVLGRQVDGAEWEAVCQKVGLAGGRSVRAALVEHGLAEREGDGWVFSHRLLVEHLKRRARDGGRWAELNRRAVEILEEVEPARPERTAARRAEHWVEAGEPERALEPLWTESKHVHRVGDLAQERRLLERRESLLDAIEAPPEDPRRLSNDLQLESDEVDFGKPAEEILESLESIRERAEAAGEDRILARAWRRTAYCQRRVGAGDPEESARRAVEPARRGGGRRELVGALYQLGWSEFHRGELDDAREHLIEAEELAAGDGETHREMRARRARALVEFHAGNHSEARDLLESLLESTREAGYRELESGCLNALGEMARFDGNVERARRLYRRYESLSRELHRSSNVAVARLNLALVELMAGNFEVADERLREAELDFEELSRSDCDDFLRLARCALAAGTGEWDAYDSVLDAYGGEWGDEQRLESDHPWLLEMAADYAADAPEDANERARAVRAWEFAVDLWERLDRPAEAERVAEKIEAEGR